MFDLLRLEQPACEEAADDGADSAKRPLLFCGQNLRETTKMGVKKKPSPHIVVSFVTHPHTPDLALLEVC